jgi:hypothetical protein
MTRAVRTLHEIARTDALGEGNHGATIGTADDHHGQTPRSRFRRPRSKPTITSWSTVMTGTAMRPVFVISSSRAAASCAMFFAANGTP